MSELRLFDTEVEAMPPAAVPEGSDRERLERKYAPLLRKRLQLGKLVSYVTNKQVPVLGLYRYKEAFALAFVEAFLTRFDVKPTDHVFDPFCGMGTTLLGAALRGARATGVDRLPFPVFVANTLPVFLSMQPGELREAFETARSRAAATPPASVAEDVAIMKVAFPGDTLDRLRRWKTAISELPQPYSDALLLLFFAMLEECSLTSKDGQFLRLMRDKAVAEPTEALERRVALAERDITRAGQLGWRGAANLAQAHLGDTRDLSSVHIEPRPTVVITSPPYPNRYDYTRTYSLELCFHFVRDFSELRALRAGILRSHIETRIEPHEAAPHPSVAEVIRYLVERREQLNNPRIPDMLVGYFVDMEQTLAQWAEILAPGAAVALVVDNVRFEGQMLPVDLILSEMAESVGFSVEEIIVARFKGNSSQQMGKFGRVPVRESVLIWRRE